MEQLAARIHTKIQKEEPSISFCDFPIRSICGIDVHVELQFQSIGAHTIECVLIITTEDVLYCEGSNTHLFSKTLDTIKPTADFTLFTVEKITDYIKQMLVIIPKLQLNKLDAKLTQEEPIDTSYIELFKFQNTEIKYDICSVCHDLCGTTTKCNHFICIECASKLDGYQSDEDSDPEYDCPLCREKFKYLRRN
jgi:hypothetical protein